jgi:hypothetical protein
LPRLSSVIREHLMSSSLLKIFGWHSRLFALSQTTWRMCGSSTVCKDKHNTMDSPSSEVVSQFLSV